MMRKNNKSILCHDHEEVCLRNSISWALAKVYFVLLKVSRLELMNDITVFKGKILKLD